jgi:hypothetical protein
MALVMEVEVVVKETVAEAENANRLKIIEVLEAKIEMKIEIIVEQEML